MKLITFYTPSHESLVRRLLGSCVREFRVTAAKGQQMGNGVFHKQGWRASMLQKMRAIRQEASEDFLFADADVVFLRPSLARIRQELEGFDCLFQDDGKGHCAGLFAMRSNTACLRLLDRCIAELESDLDNETQGDQVILNRLLRTSGVKYGKLSGLFANPHTLTGASWQGDHLKLPPDTIAFHANWAIGVKKKLRLLDMVLKEMPPAGELREETTAVIRVGDPDK